MAFRIPWDNLETAILIDAYLRVKNEKISQRDVVKEVSELLRCRAIQSGIEIDGKFRNENGISMQMKIIGGLVDEKPSGLRSATKIFTEMVALYKTRRSEFDEILIKAKGECVMQISVQEKFFEWLSARVPSAQLSEFYIVCRDIENFCMNKRILVAPLFETTDFETLQSVVTEIQTNRMFQLEHLRQHGKMKKIVEYYMTFLRENPIFKPAKVEACKEKSTSIVEAITDNSDINVSDKNIELEEVAVENGNVEQKDDISASQTEQVLTKGVGGKIEIDVGFENENRVFDEIPKNEISSFIWNFDDERIDFFTKIPIEVSYFGESKDCNGWENAFINIINFLQEDYPAIIRGMVGYRFADVGKVILSGRTGIEKISKAVELNSGLYLEVDCTPDEIVTIVRLLINKCNMDYDNIAIIFTNCHSEITAVDVSAEVTVGEIQNGNVSISIDSTDVTEEVANGEIKDYIVQILDEMNISYIDNRNNKGCLWIIGDIGLSSVFDKFAQYSAVFHYKECGGRATKGEPAWWTKDIISTADVHEGIEKESKVVISSAYEGKVAFENWLISVAGLAERSAQSYSSAVNVAGQFSVRLGFSDKELYFFSDQEQIYQISMKLLTNPEFANMNDTQHNRYRVALSKYWDYCNALSGGAIVNAPIKFIPDQDDEVKKNRISFVSWAQEQQMQNTAILAYLSDIKKCSEFAQENDYIKEEHLLLIKDANILEHVFLEMRKDSRFIKFNNDKQKRPVSAMNKLIAFRRATGNIITATSVSVMQNKSADESVYKTVPIVTTSTVEKQIKERYTAILAENFVDGFRPGKAIDRNRFRMYYSDMFGQELNEADEQLVHILLKVGTLRDERIFVKDETEQKDLLEEINDTILETFESGASCIYLDCLFAKFQEQLAEMLHIYNVDSFESVLFGSKKRSYFKRYNYLFKYNKESAPAKDVIEYMKNSHLPVTYSEIENDLWYIPLDRIKYTLVTTAGIVNVASESYLFAPNLPVSEKEIQQIAELISNALLQRSHISDVELMQLIEENCPSVIMNTPDYTMWGLRNALAYLLRERFSFRGAIISDKDEEISMAGVFSDFCQRSEHITVDELRSFASELNTVIYWSSVYGEMVRINQKEFIRRDKIHFDIEKTDSILDSLIQNTYTPIKTIKLFLHFPTIEVPWNSFVLESYIANYSKKFRLLHASYTATDCCGAIVRLESGISDYRTLIVDVLAKNTTWKSKKDALQLLVDLGYQQRRSYSDIEQVMQEAKAQMSESKK